MPIIAKTFAVARNIRHRLRRRSRSGSRRDEALRRLHRAGRRLHGGQGRHAPRAAGGKRAGKSTLVNARGLPSAEAGQVTVDAARNRSTTRTMHALGIGMVYQHFTLVPSMTVAENLVMPRSNVPRSSAGAGARTPRGVMETMPFRVPPTSRWAASRRAKAEGGVRAALPRAHFMIPASPPSSRRRSHEVLNAQGPHAREQGDGDDDHPQVPRGDGVRQRRLRPAAAYAGEAGPPTRPRDSRDDGGRDPPRIAKALRWQAARLSIRTWWRGRHRAGGGAFLLICAPEIVGIAGVSGNSSASW